MRVLACITMAALVGGCATGRRPHVPVGPESDLATDRARAAAANRRIVAGYRHACAILADGRTECWGREEMRAVPQVRFVGLATGDHHACGLGEDRRAVCWGDPRYGSTQAPAEDLVAIGEGDGVTCGLRDDMTAVCWGRPNLFKTETMIAGRLRGLAADNSMGCGLRADGTIACPDQDGRRIDLGAEVFVEMAVGGTVVCGRRADGTVRCAAPLLSDPPPTGTIFSSITGGSGICGVKADGEAACFGYYHPSVPPAPARGPFVRAAAGRNFGCGLREDGEVVCWPPLGPTVKIGRRASWCWARTGAARARRTDR
jgi:hypothetical protein